MKVKFINKSCVSLTNGKIYDVIAIEKGWYRIIDDTDEDYLFDPEEFEIIDQVFLPAQGLSNSSHTGLPA